MESERVNKRNNVVEKDMQEKERKKMRERTSKK